MMATQTPNSGLAQNVIRTNLSSLNNSLGFAQILSVTAGYSQKKKDSVQAVLIQLYTNHNSLRVSVTNYPDYIGLASRRPNTIGSVQRFPDDIGLAPVILTAGVCTKPTILAQSGCIHMTIPSAGGRDLNRINNIYSVHFLGQFNSASLGFVEQSGLLSLIQKIAKHIAITAAMIPIIVNLFISTPFYYQPLGSIPCRNNSLRASSLNQLPRLMPSLLANSDSCSLNSGGMRIWNVGDSPSPFGDLSLLIVDMYVRILLVWCQLRTYINMSDVKIATPRSARNTIEAFNHNVMESYDMAMYKSTQTHPKFKWRFFSCQQSRYFTVEARSEQEARSMLPDAPCLFSARFRQGVNHG